MKLINLYGAPSSGKSVTAAQLFIKLKSQGVATELVGEFAKELIYLGNEVQLVNQVYIMGSQYRKLKDLERAGIEVAISDSPLLLQLVYCQGKSYYEEIKALVLKLNSEFDNTDIYLNRIHPYQTYGRVHTEAESNEIGIKIRKAMDNNFKYSVFSNDEGIGFLEREIMKLVTPS
jgi:nicotinamide riboside kinase